MNAFKYNSTARYFLTFLLCKFFNIHFSEIYRKKHISVNSNSEVEIVDKDGKYYIIEVKEKNSKLV